MTLADRLLLGTLIIVAGLATLKRAEPAQRLPLIKADLPYCFTIKNPPLELTKPDTEAHPRRPDTA